jgi:tetratricopeptide (TPR) repeat protein
MGGGNSYHCPEPAVLAAFVEGKLDASNRAVVARHLGDCSECVSVAGEASRFLTEEVEEPADGESDLPYRGVRRITAAIAAILSLACLGVTLWWFVTSRRDPLLHLRGIASRAPARTIEPRLAGFSYARFLSPRSSAGVEKDPDDPLTAEAARVAALPGSDARLWHARGVAVMLLRDDTTAVRCLETATRLVPGQAEYWNDLAAAEIMRDGGRGDVGALRAAIVAADRALALAPTFASPSFNRGLASERLGLRQQAIDGYTRALSADPYSGWSAETRARLRRLRL